MDSRMIVFRSLASSHIVLAHSFLFLTRLAVLTAEHNIRIAEQIPAVKYIFLVSQVRCILCALYPLKKQLMAQGSLMAVSNGTCHLNRQLYRSLLRAARQLPPPLRYLDLPTLSWRLFGPLFNAQQFRAYSFASFLAHTLRQIDGKGPIQVLSGCLQTLLTAPEQQQMLTTKSFWLLRQLSCIRTVSPSLSLSATSAAGIAMAMLANPSLEKGTAEPAAASERPAVITATATEVVQKLLKIQSIVNVVLRFLHPTVRGPPPPPKKTIIFRKCIGKHPAREKLTPCTRNDPLGGNFPM